MTYNHYRKQAKPIVLMKLNEILAKNEQLITLLDRTSNHLLITEHSNIPFNNQWWFHQLHKKCSREFALATINFRLSFKRNE